MRMKDVGRLLCTVLIVLFLLCLLSTGCMTPAIKPDTRITIDKNVAVVPFMNYSDESFSEMVDPKSGKTIRKLQVDDYLTDILLNKLKEKKFNSIKVMPKVQKKGDKLFFVETIRNSIPEGTDILILNRIFRFRERRGRNYAVTAPASVALDIRIVDVSEGKIIHHYEYNETQQSLSENILNIKEFIKRKGRWVNALELADSGLTEGVKRMTY